LLYAGLEGNLKGARSHSYIDDEPMSQDLDQHSSNSETQGDAVWSALAEEYCGTEEHHQEAAELCPTENLQSQSEPCEENMAHEAVTQHTDSGDEQIDSSGSPAHSDVAMTEDSLGVLGGPATPAEQLVLPANMVCSMLGNNEFCFSLTVFEHS